MFYNISNHPSATWPAEKIQAANSLGGEIKDVAFPAIDYKLSTADIVKLVAKFVNEINPDMDDYALVAGDLVIGSAIVRELQHHGVTPVTSASLRAAVEK